VVFPDPAGEEINTTRRPSAQSSSRSLSRRVRSTSPGCILGIKSLVFCTGAVILFILAGFTARDTSPSHIYLLSEGQTRFQFKFRQKYQKISSHHSSKIPY
jgi:hypothetical protein